MQQTTPHRVAPPGADNTLLDKATTSPAYRAVWMALIRMAALDPDSRTWWLRSVVQHADAISVLATLRQAPETAPTLLAHMHTAQTHLRHVPVWQHLIGEHPTTAHGVAALLSRAKAYDTQSWNRLATFALPRMTANNHYRPGLAAEWRAYLGMPKPADARRARKEQRQRLRGRTPGPIGGTPPTAPTTNTTNNTPS